MELNVREIGCKTTNWSEVFLNVFCDDKPPGSTRPTRKVLDVYRPHILLLVPINNKRCFSTGQATTRQTGLVSTQALYCRCRGNWPVLGSLSNGDVSYMPHVNKNHSV